MYPPSGHRLHQFASIKYNGMTYWVDVTELRKASPDDMQTLYIMNDNQLRKISAMSANTLNTMYVLY